MQNQVNISLLRKVVEWAEAEAAKPSELCEWRQAMWVTVFDPDEESKWGIWATLESDPETYGKASECGTCYCIAGYTVASVDGRLSNPESDSLKDRAAELLGLDWEDASLLFAAGNSIGDIRRIAEEIAGEAL